MENHPPVRVALIGVSGYAGTYYKLALEELERGGLELVAATVINQAEVPEKCLRLKQSGCVLFEDYGEMLRHCRGQVDLCLIPTAIGWHVPMTVAALEAGASVLVEKPLAGDLAGVYAVQAAETLARDRFVAVGFQDIYRPGTHRLKKELLQGRIGRLQRVRLKGCWPRGEKYYGRTGWAGRLAHHGLTVNDSPLNNAFAHFLNLALFLAGPSPEESAGAELTDAELYRANPIESFDTAALRARLSTGAEFFAAVTHACTHETSPTLILEGEQGTARWEYRVGWSMTPSGGETLAEVAEPVAEAVRTMFRQVLRRQKDPEQSICGIPVARRHTELIDSLHRRVPIRTIPTRFIKEESLDGSKMLVVDQMDRALEVSFSNAALFQESGFGWAQASL